MRATTSSNFPASADQVWSLVKQSSTLLYVTRGLLGFAGADGFPREWRQGARIDTRLLFFGVLPGWRHQLTVIEVSEAKRELFTEEGGGVVQVWNHRITVEAREGPHCRYTDEVEVGAGLLTPLVWLYAKLFYRYRQWRWRSLLRRSTSG